MNNIFIYFSWLLLLLFYMYSTVSLFYPIRASEREKREDIYRELAHESSNNNTTMKFLIYESTRRVKLLE